MASETANHQGCRQAYKTTIGLLALSSFVILVVGWLLFSAIGKGLCGNEVFQEVTSPNGERKAVVFQRDCGATTGFSTQVSILSSRKDVQGGGNIFIMDGHPDWTQVEVKWLDNNSILITHSDAYKVYKAKTWYWFYTVEYNVISTEE